MDKIAVKSSRLYNILIEEGLVDKVGPALKDILGGKRVMVVTDDTVRFLYLARVENSLKASGYSIQRFVLSAGESAKTSDNYIKLLTALSDCGLERSDIIVALGGGVVSDIAGFAASTYMRGTRYVNVPTTLLAAVDSCIGGKTAIDLPSGKNLAGSFWNPSLVLIDPLTLRTLSSDTLKDGYAESIKYGILTDPPIIDLLKEADESREYSELIGRALRIKQQIIEKDEHDAGLRQYLNLGHLIGHAIECHMNFKISHGAAVASGLYFESKGCALSGLTDISVHREIADLLEYFDFDISADYTRDDLLPYVRRDKRIKDDKIKLIVPEGIGKCGMKEVDVKNLYSFVGLCL